MWRGWAEMEGMGRGRDTAFAKIIMIMLPHISTFYDWKTPLRTVVQ